MNGLFLAFVIAALIAALALLLGVDLATVAQLAAVGVFVIGLVELIRRNLPDKR